jgi:predicted nucleic acid-binding protein
MVASDRFFLDSVYLIALEVENDQHHDQASEHWVTLFEKPLTLVTTSYVLDEIVTFLNSRRQHAKAIRVGDNLLHASNIQLIHVDENLFREGWSYFKQYADKTFSLTDCVSFVLMKRLGIAEALTFDKHFEQAGFSKLPQ